VNIFSFFFIISCEIQPCFVVVVVVVVVVVDIQKLVEAVKAKNILGVYQGLVSNVKYQEYVNAEGKTLLHLAVITGFSPIVSMLIFAGINPL
jgi:hypothetical protein